jgi:hypothetical protein
VKLESRDSAALDRFERLLYDSFHRDEALGIDVGYLFNHGSTDNGFHDDALDVPVAALAKLNKTYLGTLYARLLELSTHDELLANVHYVSSRGRISTSSAS